MPYGTYEGVSLARKVFSWRVRILEWWLFAMDVSSGSAPFKWMISLYNIGVRTSPTTSLRRWRRRRHFLRGIHHGYKFNGIWTWKSTHPTVQPMCRAVAPHKVISVFRSMYRARGYLSRFRSPRLRGVFFRWVLAMAISLVTNGGVSRPEYFVISKDKRGIFFPNSMICDCEWVANSCRICILFGCSNRYRKSRVIPRILRFRPRNFATWIGRGWNTRNGEIATLPYYAQIVVFRPF